MAMFFDAENVGDRPLCFLVVVFVEAGFIAAVQIQIDPAGIGFTSVLSLSTA
jgi:hypothetical protein